MSFGITRHRARTAALTILFLLFLSTPALFAQNREMPLTASKEALAFRAGRATQGRPSLPAAGRENRRFGGMRSRARLSIARQDFAAARTQLEEMRQHLSSRKNPNQERNYNETGGLMELGQKNYAKALEYFARADPNDPYVWYYQAVAYEGAGERKSAAALYRKVADWNQLDDTGHAVVRARAAVRGGELAKLPR